MLMYVYINRLLWFINFFLALKVITFCSRLHPIQRMYTGHTDAKLLILMDVRLIRLLSMRLSRHKLSVLLRKVKLLVRLCVFFVIVLKIFITHLLIQWKRYTVVMFFNQHFCFLLAASSVTFRFADSMYTGKLPIKGYSAQYLQDDESDWNRAKEQTWPFGT